MAKEEIYIGHPVVALKFALANFAANQDGTTVPADTNADAYALPWGGSIIGLSVSLNAAVSANTITFKPTVGGTEDTDLSVQLDTTNTQRYSARCDVGKIPFTANAAIGVVYDSHASFAPTTADGVVTLFVVFDEVEY